MKTSFVLAVLTFSAATAFGAANTTLSAPKTRAPAAVETSTASRPSLLTASPTDRSLYFGTNIVSLTKSVGNASVDFFGNNKVSLGFRFQSSSEKEYNRKLGRRVPTDRTAYGVGGSFWMFGAEAQRNIVLSPFLAFGTRKDERDVENLSGFGFKAAALGRFGKTLTGELGLIGNNLDNGNFKGDIYVGVGVLL